VVLLAALLAVVLWWWCGKKQLYGRPLRGEVAGDSFEDAKIASLLFIIYGYLVLVSFQLFVPLYF
jgi:hypothetical protein